MLRGFLQEALRHLVARPLELLAIGGPVAHDLGEQTRLEPAEMSPTRSVVAGAMSSMSAHCTFSRAGAPVGSSSRSSSLQTAGSIPRA